MPDKAELIDATSMPEVSRLVREVNRTGRVQLLQVGSDLARLSPARQPRRTTRRRRGAAARTPAEREEILRTTSGGWKGLIDAERLKRELNELQHDEPTPRKL